MSLAPRAWRVAGALAAGAFFALVAPPSNLYAALWLGMAALAYLLEDDARAAPRAASGRWARVRRAFDGAGRGLAFGVGANVVFFRFIPATIVRFTALPLAAGVAGLGLLAALQGLRWVAAAVVTVQLARRGVPRWVAFAIGVYASTFVPVVFPWTPAGPISPVPEMIQLAELVGERGVALLMASSAGLLVAAVVQRRRLLFGAAILLPVLTFAEGKLRVAHVERDRQEAPTVKVGLVQPSIGAIVRWDGGRAREILERLVRLTGSSEEQGAELTIWTEGVYPYPVKHGWDKAPVGAKAVLGPGVHGPVLSGFVMIAQHGDQFNSAAVCSTDGAISRPQDKVRLLAFGERIPVVGEIPWVKRVLHRSVGLVPGSGNVVQVSGPVRASVLICVEDTLPEAGRDAMADHPNLLVNLTNDAWFEGSRESELHLRLSVLRAVESRRDMVRAVNFGPTSWIDAAGVVQGRTDGTTPVVLLATPALLEWKATPYDRFGDAPTVLLLFVVVLAGRVRARRRVSEREA